MTRTGTPGVRPALAPRLDDRKVDRVARDHARRIDDLGKLPASGMRVIRDVELADGVETPIAHGLGRRATYVRESSPRGAVATGRIEEVRTSDYDADKFVVLKASGWGAAVTIDVQVM